MAVQTAVDVLAQMLDEYETRGRSVHHVGATTTGAEDDSLHAELEVPVPLYADGDGGADRIPAGATLTDDGDLTVQVPTSGIASVPSPPEADVSATPTAARVFDGEILLTLAVTITPTDGGSRARSDSGSPAREDTHRDADANAPRSDRTEGIDVEDGESNEGPTPTGTTVADETPDPIEAARNEAVPPYEDEEYLRAIYQQFDTFSEMRDAIEMDVSTETVRRYMIDAGIHDPSTYETTADAASRRINGREAPADDTSDPIPDEQLVTDGIGLPDDLSLEDVLDAVVESSTVYEVTRALELEQRRTREILEHLDLLDLVMHRVSDDRTREVSYEEVADRLRRVAATT